MYTCQCVCVYVCNKGVHISIGVVIQHMNFIEKIDSLNKIITVILYLFG